MKPPGRRLPFPAFLPVMIAGALLLHGAGRVGNAAPQEPDANARRAPSGELRVTTDPPGAAVQVGMQQVGLSPATFRALPVGRHKVTVSKQGYQPVTFLIDLLSQDSARTNVVLISTIDWVKQTARPRVTTWLRELRIGEHDTLQAALREAPPGAKLELTPGYYEASVVLDRPLEITAQGPAEQTIVASAGAPCVRMATEKAMIRGITLHGLPSEEAMPYAVDVPRGELVMERCIILSKGGPGVGVYGQGASVRLDACRIQSDIAGGLLFAGHAGGQVVGCEIDGTAGPGIEIRDGSDPQILRSTISNGRAAGVLVHAGGRGLLEECTIAFQGMAGLEIRDGGDPRVRGGRIMEGNGGGVLVHRGGRGVILDCNIYGNKLSNVEIRDEGDPWVKNSRIHHGHQNGILVHQNGRGTIEGCNVSSHLLAGLEVRDGGDPRVVRSEFQRGFASGIFIHRGGRGTFEFCDILENALAGLEIGTQGDPVLKQCKLLHGRQAGVLVHRGGRGRIEQCVIRGNAAQGVEVRDGGEPSLRQCEISGNGFHGMLLHQQGRAHLDRSWVGGNGRRPYSVSADSKLVVAGE